MRTMNFSASTPAPWYAHRWPWLLMAGPLMVVLAGIYTGWLAFSQPDALVVDDYYKQGKAINQDLRRDRAAAALELELNLRYDAAAGVLRGALAGKGGPVTGPLQVRLLHPTQPARDLRLLANADAAGNFSLALPMLDRARWQVQVESGEREWRLRGAWKWPDERAVRLAAEPAR